MVVLCIQVNEKTCRVENGYIGIVQKQKETRLGWEYNSYIVGMYIIMRRSEISLLN